MRKPVEFANWPEHLAVAFGPYRAVVGHHVDGDTFDALISPGLHSYHYHTIRVLDVDTPETNRLATRQAGLEALAFVRGVMPIGAKVLLHTRKDPDSFGRFLARVTLSDGSDLAARILNAGLGVPT